MWSILFEDHKAYLLYCMWQLYSDAVAFNIPMSLICDGVLYTYYLPYCHRHTSIGLFWVNLCKI